MNNIKRLVFLSGTLFLSQFSFAQDSCSDNKIVIPNVTWNVDQVQVITSKTVRDIDAQIVDSAHKRGSFELSAPVGLFSKDMSVLVTPKVYQIKNNKGQGCYSLDSVDVKINFKPKIYITLEAMQFACTKARVYEHELNHYNIEILALNRIPTFLRDVGYKNYMKINSLPLMPNAQFQNELGKILSVGTRDILNLMETSTVPEHEKLDTVENYKFEMDKCSVKENELLNNLIKNGGALHQQKLKGDSADSVNEKLKTNSINMSTNNPVEALGVDGSENMIRKNTHSYQEVYTPISIEKGGMFK